MSKAVFCGRLPMFAGISGIPSSRGRFYAANGQAIERVLLSTDSIGNFILTLQNVVIGSAIQIATQLGTAIENRTATHTTEVFTVPAYIAGNAGNDLSIKVRKGTSTPFFQPYETQAAASVGSQSIFVSQTPDE